VVHVLLEKALIVLLVYLESFLSYHWSLFH
jgi:hypothetical protein